MWVRSRAAFKCYGWCSHAIGAKIITLRNFIISDYVINVCIAELTSNYFLDHVISCVVANNCFRINLAVM